MYTVKGSAGIGQSTRLIDAVCMALDLSESGDEWEVFLGEGKIAAFRNGYRTYPHPTLSNAAREARAKAARKATQLRVSRALAKAAQTV